MKFKDLFIPRWRNSNPDVRKKAVRKIKDIKLLESIAELDESSDVRSLAESRVKEVKSSQAA